jgi:hypothetical protein
MTLKEKFDIISCKDCDMPFCETKCTILSEYELNKLEKIADDYAIEFYLWMKDNEERIKNGKIITDKDLLKEFKKEKYE